MKNNMDTQAATAEALARDVHKGQIYAPDFPYISHVERIARYFTGDDYHQTVAWLHDIVEDTKINIDYIVEHFGPDVARDVEILSRPPGQPYRIYINYIRENTVAKRIKIIDLTDNLSNCRDIDGDTIADYESRASRYSMALHYLLKVDTLN